MSRASVVAFGIVVVLGLVWVAAQGDDQVPLVELPERPRLAPEFAPSDRPLALDRLGRRMAREGHAARSFRNEQVERWREALARHDAGEGTLRAAEGVEFDVWEARARTGEIDEQAMREAFVELLEREISRLRGMQAKGLATQDAVRRATLYWERERIAAGLADAAAIERYEQARVRYLEDRDAHFRALLETRNVNRDHARVEMELLEVELAPAAGLLPSASS